MADNEITIAQLQAMKRQGEKIVALTCYDASFAVMLDAAGIDVLLVGDSLGMVVQGRENTLPVSVDEMVYHTRCVVRGRSRSFVLVDFPFLSYASSDQALMTAARLMKEGGGHMVKLEGGASQLDTVRRLTAQGVPVCGHLGLLPQSVHLTGGYRVQGRGEADAARIREEALALEDAGAGLLVLECVPEKLATAISRSLSIPVIGIGAGPGCDGQVLVLYDMLGITSGKCPKFVKRYAGDGRDIRAAIAAYAREVRESEFPGPEHCFS